MTLIISNDDVQSVLTREMTMQALEKAYEELTRQEAVCRPRIDIQIPTPRFISGEPWKAGRSLVISPFA